MTNGSSRRVEVVAQLDAGGTLIRRYIRGDAADEVLLEYVGSGTSDYRFQHQGERNSTIAWSDPSGAMASILHYGEYGVPTPTNPGFFQYTGQMWLPEIGIHHYKNRAYHPRLGRFLQTDLIAYAAGPNLYAYVGNDPVNFVDPLGLVACPGEVMIRTGGAPTYTDEWGAIVVTASSCAFRSLSCTCLVIVAEAETAAVEVATRAGAKTRTTS